jgi:hypothetical protein
MYLPTGTVLNNRYQIDRVLGHGGFGITYLARDLALNVHVAVKEYLPRQLATRAEGASQVSIYTGEAREHYLYGLKKFLEEARSVAQFADHPNIVSTRDFFEANGTAYMVMRYVQGVDFKEYLGQQGGRISFELALKIMMPVMDALRAVHSAGLLHRDVSPDNIYLTRDGQVRLMDFGAARQQTGEHSRSLSVILKTGYAPPEQYRTRGKQGPWTDIYATAATIYRAITGQTPPEALERLEQETLVPPSQLGVTLPEQGERALLKALAIKAEDRFQTMEQYQEALRGGAPAPAATPLGEALAAPVGAAVAAQAASASAQAARPRVALVFGGRPRKTKLALVAALTVVAGVLLVAGVGSYLGRLSAPVVEALHPARVEKKPAEVKPPPPPGRDRGEPSVNLPPVTPGQDMAGARGQKKEELTAKGPAEAANRLASLPAAPAPAGVSAPQVTAVPAAPSVPADVGQGRWPWTARRPVTEEDLRSLTGKELQLMRSEILARHGMVFKERELQRYFQKEPWYRPRGTPDNMVEVNKSVLAELSPVEKENADRILRLLVSRRPRPSAPPAAGVAEMQPPPRASAPPPSQPRGEPIIFGTPVDRKIR